MKRIGIIGGGNMGTAIIGSIFEKYSVAVCEQDQQKAKFLQRKFGAVVQNLAELVQQSDVIIVAVKPQDVAELGEKIKHLVNKSSVVVSIAAGLKIFKIQKLFGHKKVLRMMPNWI